MNEPIPYGVAVRRSRHDTVYTALLGAMAFFILIATGEMFFLRRRINPDAAWVFSLVGFIYASLLLFMIAVLAIRIAWPAQRKWVTVTLNVILLVLIPFGTVLGIYGLWKVDKDLSAD